MPLVEIELNIDLRDSTIFNEECEQEEGVMLDINVGASELVSSTIVPVSSTEHLTFDLNNDPCVEDNVQEVEDISSTLEGEVHREEKLLEDDMNQLEDSLVLDSNFGNIN